MIKNQSCSLVQKDAFEDQAERRSLLLSHVWMPPACRRSDYSSVTETLSLSLPAPPLCAGIGYSMFSHGGLSRSLDMKSPPPLNLGSENLRGDPGNQATRVNHGSAVRSRLCRPAQAITRDNWSFLLCFCADQRGVLYGGLHGGSSMVAMGRAGLLGHSFGGYGFPSQGTAGTSECVSFV